MKTFSIKKIVAIAFSCSLLLGNCVAKNPPQENEETQMLIQQHQQALYVDFSNACNAIIRDSELSNLDRVSQVNALIPIYISNFTEYLHEQDEQATTSQGFIQHFAQTLNTIARNQTLHLTPAFQRIIDGLYK